MSYRRDSIREQFEQLLCAEHHPTDAGAAVSSAAAVASTTRKSGFNAEDRVAGMLLGCAIGDALGMPVEGVDNRRTLRAIRRLGGIRDFLAPQSHVLRSLRNLRPGCWTDDTQLTIAIAKSIVRKGTLDYDDVASAHVDAFQNLELRGWGATTKQACRRLSQGTARRRAGKLEGAGNGVAMKISPIAAYSFLNDDSREDLLQHILEIGVMTHYDARALTGAYVIALLVRDGLASQKKWEPSPERFFELIEEAEWAESKLAPAVGKTDDPVSRHMNELCDAVDVDVEPSELAEFCNGAGGYVCESVPFVAALLCGRGWEFEEGVLAAVNAGGDTDSNAAMVGAVLGAAWGMRKLPKRYIEKVEEAELIRDLGRSLARPE